MRAGPVASLYARCRHGGTGPSRLSVWEVPGVVAGGVATVREGSVVHGVFGKCGRALCYWLRRAAAVGQVVLGVSRWA